MENTLLDYLKKCDFSGAEGILSSSVDNSVICGVSGGADSGALLVMSSIWADGMGCDLKSVYVDHGLREGTEAEAQKVEELAKRCGASFECVRAGMADGPNLEARARDVRRELLGLDCLLGHTADDQAETVLMRLMRGSGIDGLSAMDSVRRPLLGLRRSDTESICEIFGYDYVTDPSNEDARFTRNRVRGELLDLMCDIAQRDVVPLLCRTAHLASEESKFLNDAALAYGIDPADTKELSGMDPVMAKRILRTALEIGGVPPDMAAVDRVMDIVNNKSVRTQILGGRSVWRRHNRLYVDGAELTI